MRSANCHLLVAVLASTMTLSLAAQATGVAAPPCVLSREDHFRCDPDVLRKHLQAAHTIRVVTDRMDRFGAAEVRKLVEATGKQVSKAGQPPDLIFDLAPVDRNGRIDVGPGTVALATFSVFDPGLGEGRQGLIWVETYDGSEARPWPAVVTDLLRQFQSHATAH